MLKARHRARVAIAALAWVMAACRGEALQLGSNEPPPSPVPRDLTERCRAAPATVRTFADRAEMEAALRGRWFRCRGVEAGVLFPPGIEFDEARNNRWYSLIDDGAGEIVRATDDARQGNWQVTPPLTLQIQFSNASQQTLIVLFDESGEHFSVARTTFGTVDVGYVKE